MRAIICCGFCFSASCTKPSSVRRTAAGEPAGTSCASKPEVDSACTNIKSGTAARRKLAGMYNLQDRENRSPRNRDYNCIRKFILRMPDTSRFRAEFNGHCYQRANEYGGEQLAHDRFRDRQRPGVRVQYADIAADGRERAKTEIRELRGHLIHVQRRRGELKRTRVTLLYELVRRSPRHAEQQIDTDPALNTAPGHLSPPKHA